MPLPAIVAAYGAWKQLKGKRPPQQQPQGNPYQTQKKNLEPEDSKLIKMLKGYQRFQGQSGLQRILSLFSMAQGGR